MKSVVLMLGCVLLLGCQDNTVSTQESVVSQENIANTSSQTPTPIVANQATLNIDDVIKTQDIAFRKTTGHYPLLIDEAYQEVNADIQAMIGELTDFDGHFSDEMVEGVDSLEYSVLHFDEDKLAFGIEYNVQDMTGRYFKKYYQLDLKHKKLVSLDMYLTQQQVDRLALNTAFNAYVKPCMAEEQIPEYCHNPPLMSLLNGYGVNASNIDIVQDHSSFYVLDKDTIEVLFDSIKFTVGFTINIRTHQITVN